MLPWTLAWGISSALLRKSDCRTTALLATSSKHCWRSPWPTPTSSTLTWRTFRDFPLTQCWSRSASAGLFARTVWTRCFTGQHMLHVCLNSFLLVHRWHLVMEALKTGKMWSTLSEAFRWLRTPQGNYQYGTPAYFLLLQPPHKSPHSHTCDVCLLQVASDFAASSMPESSPAPQPNSCFSPPCRFQTIHCLLYADTDWCPKKWAPMASTHACWVSCPVSTHLENSSRLWSLRLKSTACVALQRTVTLNAGRKVKRM